MRTFLFTFLAIFYLLEVEASDSDHIVVTEILRYIDILLNAVTNETSCAAQIGMIIHGLKNLEPWTIFFLDASGKLQPSLLTGNIYLQGGYDECMQINIAKDNELIEGQYCRAVVRPSKQINKCIQQKFDELGITSLGRTSIRELTPFQEIYYDACVPAACSAVSLQRFWDLIEAGLDLNFNLEFSEASCTTLKKQNIYTTLDIICMSIFSIIGLVIILSTLYDVSIFQRNKQANQLNLFMAFSFYTNGKRLFSVKRKKSVISCLNGIKVISLAWIILGHRTLISFMQPTINAAYTFEWMKHQENMFIVGSFASVDTFFLISGFLIIYIQMTIMEQGMNINLLAFYCHRMLRLTPALAAILMLYLGILKHLGAGPNWFYVDMLITESCKRDWWSILIYVQNYISPWSACLPQGWYISVDTQLYFISPLIVLPMFRWIKSTIALVVVLVIVSNAHAVYLIYHFQMDGLHLSVIANYWQHLYVPAHLRLTPWLTGIVLGYYMFIGRDKKIFIQKGYVFLLWAIALLLLLLVIYGYILMVNIKITLFRAAIFFVFSRIFWSAGIGWVIFACERGYGGFINDFLSLPIFSVVARLSYSIFLTHPLIIVLMVAQRRTTSYIDNLSQFHYFWGDYAFSIGLSIIWTLTFESPITILEKALLKRAKRRHSKIEDETTMEPVNNGVNEAKQSCD